MRPAITFLNIQLSNSRHPMDLCFLVGRVDDLNGNNVMLTNLPHHSIIPSLTVEKQKNGCKASKINACSRFLFRNDMCYCAIFFTLW